MLHTLNDWRGFTDISHCTCCIIGNNSSDVFVIHSYLTQSDNKPETFLQPTKYNQNSTMSQGRGTTIARSIHQIRTSAAMKLGTSIKESVQTCLLLPNMYSSRRMTSRIASAQLGSVVDVGTSGLLICYTVCNRDKYRLNQMNEVPSLDGMTSLAQFSNWT